MIASEPVNAFALPGGFLLVNSGRSWFSFMATIGTERANESDVRYINGGS
jgi:predicted Zn-dependent protease